MHLLLKNKVKNKYMKELKDHLEQRIIDLQKYPTVQNNAICAELFGVLLRLNMINISMNIKPSNDKN